MYYVVQAHVLPEIFAKVVQVKNLLENNKLLTVQEATERIGISRSSFYKYRDAVFPFYENGGGKAITVLIHLRDEAGRLSNLLNCIAESGGNVLTINQMIPMNGIAIINMCVQTALLKMGVDELINLLKNLEGVKEVQILARE